MSEVKDLQERVASLEAAVSVLNSEKLANVTGASTEVTATPPPRSPSPEPYPARLEISNDPPTPQNSLLLNLSAELRYEIYQLVMIFPNRYIDVRESGYARPALLNTCKEVYLETSPIFYANHTFDLQMTDYDSTICDRWTREVKHLKCKTVTITTNTGPPNWKNLVSWLKKYQSRKLSVAAYTSSNSPKQKLQEKIVHSYFDMARTMNEYPWELFEAIMDDLRPGLSAIDGRWAQN